MFLETDLNPGAGNACASHNKLIVAPFATSKESDFADFGNFGDTRPAGSNVRKQSLLIILTYSDTGIAHATAVLYFID